MSAHRGAAIVGIGQTEFSKAAGRSETQLASEAIVAALRDAGSTPEQVDGLVSYTIDPVEETELVRALGIPEIRWSSRVPYGGGGSQGVLLHAAAAVSSGAARVVVVYRAIKARSGALRACPGERPSDIGAFRVDRRAVVFAVWRLDSGVVDRAHRNALHAHLWRHERRLRSGRRAAARLRLDESRCALLRKPITLDDHQASRWIAEPAIRLFDCCQETDGSVALVITAGDRARDTPAPVTIAEAATAGLFEEEIASNHYRPDLAVMDGSVALADQLFGSGIDRSDVDVAMIYDAFRRSCSCNSKGLGFCGFGEAKEFVADGHLGPKGQLPCNTNGGLIGEGYIHGLNLTTEAVRQLRGTAVNQLDDPRTALVTASRTGVILQRAVVTDRRGASVQANRGSDTSRSQSSPAARRRHRRAEWAAPDHRSRHRIDPRSRVLSIEHE